MTTTIAGSAANASWHTPREPGKVPCDHCGEPHHLGAMTCPHCGECAIYGDHCKSFAEYDEWHEQWRQNWRDLLRWQQWEKRQSLRIVASDHPRYVAWMVFRTILSLKDYDTCAHVAALAVMGMVCNGGVYTFRGIKLTEEAFSIVYNAAGDDYNPAFNELDRTLIAAALQLWRILTSNVGECSDILPTDHEQLLAVDWRALQ